MEMFYYPVSNGMLEPVNHMQARTLLAVKLKQRDENGEDAPFSIWSSRNVNCPKFACIEDLDEWVSYISSIEGPLQVASKLKAF
jgi:hypothetical protein